MKLYSFFNSSAAYRVRIALNLKGLAFEYEAINLRTLENHDDHYRAHNPIGLVPTLQDGDMYLGQSLAIMDYLDQCQPDPLLIPRESTSRARILEFACLIACDTHPLNNLRALRYLRDVLKVDQAQEQAWYAHWIAQGLSGAEQLVNRYGAQGPWCFGDNPTLADCCLIPQLANARRMACDLSAYPHLTAIEAHALQHPAFMAAAPSEQPDFIPS